MPAAPLTVSLPRLRSVKYALVVDMLGNRDDLKQGAYFVYRREWVH